MCDKHKYPDAGTVASFQVNVKMGMSEDLTIANHHWSLYERATKQFSIILVTKVKTT